MCIVLVGWLRFLVIVVYPHTNTRWNLIKDDLRLLWMNKTLLYKNISLILFLEKGPLFVVVWEIDGETYLCERTYSSHIFFQESGCANVCTPTQARQGRLWSAACPLLDSDCLPSIEIWPRGSHHVVSIRLHTCSTWVPRSCCSVYQSKCDSLPKHTGSRGTNRKSVAYVIWYYNLQLNLWCFY